MATTHAKTNSGAKTAPKATAAPAKDPGGLRGLLARRAADWSVNDLDPTFMNRHGRFWNLMADHYFRTEFEGWHKVPDEPVLLVGVHTGGTICYDAWLFAFQWWRRFGESRILHTTAHDVLRAAPGLGAYMKAGGTLPPHPRAMDAAWKAGHDVVLWPGNVDDAFRTWKNRDKAILGGRVGFLKVAMRSGVPIVPYATTGASDTGFILSEGKGLAKLVNAKKHLRSDRLPVIAAPPFGLTVEILPTHLPMPAKIRYEFQDPIRLDSDPDLLGDEEYLRTVYDQVEGSIQAGMDRLAKRRSFPFFG